MLEEAKDVIGKQLGPFKGWQWALIGGVPIGLWIFLSNRGKGDAEASPTPQPVGADNSVYGPGDAAILARLNEIANTPASGGSDSGIPMANLSLLGINLQRAAARPEYVNDRSQLLSWAGLIFDMVRGSAEYDQGVIDQIISYMRAAGIPLTDLLTEPTNPPPTNPPPTNPPPTNPPPTNPPPTNPPPTNPPPTNPPPQTPTWSDGQTLWREWIRRAEEIPDARLRSEYLGLINGKYGELNQAVASGRKTPAQASNDFRNAASGWLDSAKN